MLHFSDIHDAKPGTLAALLEEAYAPLLSSAIWRKELVRWAEFDREAFGSPAVGRCVFLTWSEGALAGFGSFDPRGIPDHARIGHHCVAASHRGRGIGAAQVREILRRLEALGARSVEATTLDLPFFLAARRTYQAAGFAELSRSRWDADAAVALVRFEKTIPETAR